MYSSFAVNKYLHTVASVGFLFTLNYDARSLGWLVVEHNCVNIGAFIDFVEQQLHVSAFIGHRQVVLREVNEFH